MENKQDSYLVSRIIAIVVICAGISGMIGWIFDISFLKTISENWVSMKFATAVLFVISGSSLYVVTTLYRQNGIQGYPFKPSLKLVLFLFAILFAITFMLLDSIGGYNFGFEDPEEMVLTIQPGTPSIAVMISFLIVGIITGATLLHETKYLKIICWGGFLLVIIGGVALFGYITSQPSIYYYYPDISAAMAFRTAILFVILGIGYMRLSRSKYLRFIAEKVHSEKNK